jgi:Rieske Fe-S protein
MDPRTSSDLTRRHVLRGAALSAFTLPVLVACGDDGGGEPEGSATPEGSSPSPSASASPTRTPGDGPGSTPTGEPLANTSEIEVGGAVFLDDPSVVITQPEAGEFHAFDRTCTHQQCPVTDISDGRIHCQCHGSLYDLSTGENVAGPAPAPLTEVPITVQDGRVFSG